MKLKHNWLKSVALLLSLTLLLGAVPVSARSSDEIREEIRELEKQDAKLQEEMERLEAQLADNLDQIQDMVAQKNTLDQQITLIYQQIENLNAQIKAYGLLVADKQDALDAAQARLDALNEKYKDRIRAMEEEGKLSYWAVIFKANSFSDLLDRLNMVREIAEADQKRMEELRQAAQEVADAKADLETQKLVLEENRKLLVETQAELEAKRAQADELLRELVARGEEFEALLDASEEAQRELMEEMAKMDKELDKALYLEWLATYVPPKPETPDVPAPEVPESDEDWITPVPYYTLTSPFGMRLHPILGYYRMHNGVDMACASGTVIYASRGGQVEITGYQANGAGNYVQINHGDGFRSIYMHMTNYIVTQGQYVAPGQIIGYVGNTGLSKGAHLHFGISYNGQYVNPMEYIG